ncbi:MAG: 50S ribosome-binding GTPase [Methanoregulaceae archaeon]|nr:50S ribosome-binding GTPase [Methanoregulaceae archaeon]
MEFEKIPTVPTADEIMDRSLRRAAAKMREKRNKDRANQEFVRAIGQAIHDRLVQVISSFPDFDELPPFYRELVEILYGIERLKKSLGAVGWAARWSRLHGPPLVMETRRADVTAISRRRAVARLSSVVHQVDGDLRFLNDVRNVLRKLPHVDDSFTIVVAGYPNVGKSSFIRLVSTAAPEVAGYAFTTQGIIVGHRETGCGRIQFIDTPGVLDRPPEKRNRIERQAMCAMGRIADVILFIIDPSGTCGYPLEDQENLLEEVKSTIESPVVVAANKADILPSGVYKNMSTATGEGVDEVLEALLAYQSAPTASPGPMPEGNR